MKSCKSRRSDTWVGATPRKHYDRCGTTGKVRYIDTIDAMLVLAKAESSKAGAKRNECRYYRCLFCKGWHLTSRPDRYKHSV